MPYICANCIDEPVLKRHITGVGTDKSCCEYCNIALPTVDLSVIAKKCDDILETFFEESSHTMAVVHYNMKPAGHDLKTTIKNLIRASDIVVQEVVEILQVMWYDRDSGEHKYGDDEPWFSRKTRVSSYLPASWTDMEISLRHEARYLNRKVERFMDLIFGNIKNDLTANGTPVLVEIGSGSSYDTLYRARSFQSEKSLEQALCHPERYLGAPSPGVGGSGRMNAAGIPAFYGATSPDVALAEVRPPVGSFVAIAKFTVIRPMQLLDLSLLGQAQIPHTASLFDEATKITAQRHDFLQGLCQRMTAPVVPESQERNYLITQIVADYLATQAAAPVDGIIYPSVQQNETISSVQNKNVVLFHKAAIAIDARQEKPTASVELWEQEDDEPTPRFKPRIVYFPNPEPFPYKITYPGFHPEPSLRLIRDSIVIHHVRSVKIHTTADPVLTATL